MSFSFNIGLFRGFFGQKNGFQKMPKSIANPLQKWLKMAICSQFFLDQKTYGNGLKWMEIDQNIVYLATCKNKDT